MGLKNKTILITGAQRGIGREIAFYFALKGYNLILTYNQNSINLNDIDFLKRQYHIFVDVIKLDLTKEEDINNLVNIVKNKYKTIDILINNAALSLDNYLFDKTKEEFLQVLEVNVVGTFLMMKKFSSLVKYVFNISSTDALDTGNAYNIDYSSSKAAINCMTKYFALFHKDVKYFALCPNWVNTEAISEMNQEFLNNELKRIKQEKLINPRTIPIVINKCLLKNIESGSIIRIDGDINEE